MSRVCLVAGLMLASLAVGGCSSTIASLPVVGEPQDTPARPSDPGSFPAVHDMPPPRAEATLPVAEQARIEGELAAARERQAAEAAAANTPIVTPAGR